MNNRVQAGTNFPFSGWRVKPWLAGTLIFLSAVAVACGAGADKTFEQTFDVGASPRLEIGAGNGDVDIRTGVDQQITVLGEISSSNNVDLDVEQEGDVVVIKSRTTTSGNLIGDRAEGKVDLTVSVPIGTVVDVGITSGTVTVLGVHAGGRITVSEGQVTLSGVSGDFSGGTGSGDVAISGSTGSFRFTTGVGAISFEGRLASGGSNDFETGDGDVTVMIPDDAGVRINATVSSGSISTDFDIENESEGASNPRGRFSGTIGDGRAELAITVGTGSVWIRPESGR